MNSLLLKANSGNWRQILLYRLLSLFNTLRQYNAHDCEQVLFCTLFFLQYLANTWFSAMNVRSLRDNFLLECRRSFRLEKRQSKRFTPRDDMIYILNTIKHNRDTGTGLTDPTFKAEGIVRATEQKLSLNAKQVPLCNTKYMISYIVCSHPLLRLSWSRDMDI